MKNEFVPPASLPAVSSSTDNVAAKMAALQMPVLHERLKTMTVRDLIFIYSYVLYENTDQIFSALPDERADLIKKELKKFERFPKEVRLSLVLKLLGYLVQHVRNFHLEMMHPSWVAESLRKENSRVTAVILKRFPPDFQKHVLDLLGIHINIEEETEGMQADSQEAIFQIYSNRFSSMGPPWGDPELTLETVYLLKEEDLVTFMKQLGIREMARAFGIAGKDVLAALVTRFPADLQKDFLNAIKLAKSTSSASQKLATKRLNKYDIASVSMEEAALKVGLSKLGAVLQKKGDVIRKIAQRMPFEYGMILLQADKEESPAEEEEEINAILNHLIAQQRILFAAGGAEATRMQSASKAPEGPE